MTVRIHLTYWAPGCSDLESRDPALWHDFPDLSAEAAVLWISERVGRSVQGLAVRDEHLGSCFYGRHPDCTEPVRMATILNGLSFTDLADALQSLKRKKAA